MGDVFSTDSLATTSGGARITLHRDASCCRNAVAGDSCICLVMLAPAGAYDLHRGYRNGEGPDCGGDLRALPAAHAVRLVRAGRPETDGGRQRPGRDFPYG